MLGQDTAVCPLNIFPTTTQIAQKRKTGELTVRSGVCMMCDNQRKGIVKKIKCLEPKYTFPLPQKYRAGIADQSVLKI